MPALNPANPLPTPIQQVLRQELQYPVSLLPDLTQLIRQNKFTGSLTINYSNGTPAGNVQWTVKEKT